VSPKPLFPSPAQRLVLLDGEFICTPFTFWERTRLHPVDANREMLDTGKRALVGVVAGGVWISWAVVVARPIGLPVLVVAIAAGSVLSICCAYCVLMARKSLPEQSRLPRRRLNWGFLMVSMLEGIGVGVVVVAAKKMGRLDLLPDWIGLVIGLHFFLLARVFRTPFYNLTAAATQHGAFCRWFSSTAVHWPSR
jgi:hypothetical protein